MTKLFVTGATGYIGGDALYLIANTYPDLEITALVRNSDKGAKVASQYPKIRLVYGDLESTSLLTTEAANADIVLHCANCDHVGSANALIAGLSQRNTPSHLIHTSGTGILAWADAESSTYGVERKKVYDDWDNISEVTSLPDTAVHRNVDKLVLAAHTNAPQISTAIVCPPCIYGPGRGPDNRESVQAYRYSAATLKRGKGFVVEGGTNVWTQVHVRDLSAVFLALVTAALQPGGSGNVTWNDAGYYFAEAGSFAWGDVGRAIAQIALDKGFIGDADVESITVAETNKLDPSGSYLWGTNSRCKAVRAREVLGWEPKEKGLMELLPEIVEGEATKLGVRKGHAVKAAGDA